MSPYSSPLIRSFADIPPLPVSWLWPNYIPRGRLTLLAADPGIGKTALILDLASRLSNAFPLPPTPTPPIPQSPPSATARANPPRHPTNPSPHPTPPHIPEPQTPNPEPLASLLLSPEDNPADSLRPRLDAMHAHLPLIHILSLAPPSAAPSDQPAPSLLQTLTSLLPNLPNLALLVIDPITAFLPLAANTAPLHALANLAQQHHLAILLTTRLTKRIPSGSLISLRRALGSLAFSSACRCVHLLLPDTTPKATGDPKSPPRLLIPIKSNCSSLPPPLTFSLSQTLDWDPASIPPHHPLLIPNDRVYQAAEFLKSFLAPGPAQPPTIFRAAAEQGFPNITIRRAKTALDIESTHDGYGGPWYWCLPGDTRKPQPLPSSTPMELLSIFDPQ